MMKNLIERIFKREAQHKYIIAEYKPTSDYVVKKPSKVAERDYDSLEDKDEMEIDNIYQKN